MRTKAHGYAVHAEKTPLAPFTFERRDLRPNDVGIEILFMEIRIRWRPPCASYRSLLS